MTVVIVSVLIPCLACHLYVECHCPSSDFEAAHRSYSQLLATVRVSLFEMSSYSWWQLTPSVPGPNVSPRIKISKQGFQSLGRVLLPVVAESCICEVS